MWNTRVGAVAMAAGLAAIGSSCGGGDLDKDVFPKITSASIAADPSHTEDLASVKVSIDLDAGPQATRSVVLAQTLLRDPAAYSQPITERRADLLLAFPQGFDANLKPDERRSVDLVNAATSNAALAGLCGEVLNLFVLLGYADEPQTTTVSPSFPVVISCP